MTDFPDLKLKALVSFPASVIGGAGIGVVKENGGFQFDLTYGDFAPPVGGIPDAAHQTVLLFNTITGGYVLAPMALVAAGSGIPEAPNDGVQYGRKSLTWSPVVSGGAPSGTNPIMDGTATPGTAASYARGDHVHPTDTSRAPLNSPALTGNPTAPTPTAGDNDTSIATTAFVQAAVGAGGSFVDAPSDGSSYGRLNGGWANVAPLNSPAFIGNPTAPTQTAGDNDTSIATTAFVSAAVASVVDNTPWTSYTPSFSATSGSATCTGRYKVIGKSVFVSVAVHYTTAVTGMANVSLPFSVASPASFAGKEVAAIGIAAGGWCLAGEIVMYFLKYDGTAFTDSGNVILLSGVYERT